MSKLHITALLASLIVGPSIGHTADLPIKALPAVPTWTGFFLGIGTGLQASMFTARTRSVTENGVPDLCPTFGGPANDNCFYSHSLNNAQFRFSFYGGLNWQVDKYVLIGMEADGGWARQITGVFGTALPGGPFIASGFDTDQFSVKPVWDASARARAGYLVTPTFLVYATGGLAVLNFSSTIQCGPDPIGTCAFPVPAFTRTSSFTRLGWTAGAGIETRVFPNVLVRGEYRYSDYGTIHVSETVIANGVVNIFDYDVRPRTHNALIGFAYLFGN